MLYIMRHGITDWNKERKLQGRTDIPLNAEGREMAERAAEEYKDVHLDICFCSPLVRARETAEILLRGRDVPIIVDDRLKEMSFGDYEGVGNSFRNPECPINSIFFKPEEYKEPIGGSETFEELFARTGEFLKDKAEPLLARGKDVLIVGHGAMNTSIVCQRKNIAIKDFWTVDIGQCKLMEI